MVFRILFSFTLIVLLVSAWLGGIIHFSESEQFPITLFQVIFPLAFIGLLFQKLAHLDFEIKLTGVEYWVLGFTGLMFFTLMYSQDHERGLILAVRFLLLVLFILYLVNQIESLKQLNLLIWVVSVTAIGLGAYSVIFSLLNPELAFLNFQLAGKAVVGRAEVTDSDPNFFASMFFLPLAFSAALVHSRERLWIRGLGLAMFGLFLAALISTYSRGAWVAAFFSLLLVAYFFRNPKPVLLACAAGLISILAIPDLQVLFIGVFSRLEGLFSGSLDSSASTRIVLGQAAIHMFADSWTFGVGFGSFPSAFKAMGMSNIISGVSEPHNILYHILAEMGLTGFLVFSVLIILIFRFAIQNIRLAKSEWERVLSISLLSSFTAYFILHQFIPRFLTNTTLMVTIAFIFVLNRVLANRSTDEREPSSEYLPT